ncbi:MAG: hypothetical protein ABIZ56_11385 [Chthoniobacteraceae bacterium]
MEALAVSDLEACGIVGQAVQALEHEHLEFEQGMETMAAFPDLCACDPADAQQRRLERRHIKVLQELIGSP